MFLSSMGIKLVSFDTETSGCVFHGEYEMRFEYY